MEVDFTVSVPAVVDLLPEGPIAVDHASSHEFWRLQDTVVGWQRIEERLGGEEFSTLVFWVKLGDGCQHGAWGVFSRTVDAIAKHQHLENSGNNGGSSHLETPC